MAGISKLVAPTFWAKVRKTESCWIWTGGLTGKGYGAFTFEGKTFLSHRLSYELCVNTIPPGMQLDHLCRNRMCVNPIHLEAVTPKVNIRRGIGLPAINYQKTHCPQGHPYNGDNLYTAPDGSRKCKICRDLIRKRWELRIGRGRGRSVKTKCPHGHDFTPENTYINTRGHRSCLTCRKIRNYNRYSNHRKPASFPHLGIA